MFPCHRRRIPRPEVYKVRRRAAQNSFSPLTVRELPVTFPVASDGSRQINCKLPAPEISSVQILDGIFGLPCNPQLHKPEASRLTGQFVLHEFNFSDFITLRFEPLLKISLCASKRNVADK